MKKLSVKITSKLGLHARPATEVVSTAQKYESHICIEKNNKRVDGKSIIGVLSVEAMPGDELLITADGQDEREAIAALEALFTKTLAGE